MYNIGIRINHGTFHGVKLVTNHNFLCINRINIGTKVPLKGWGSVGEVYQCVPRSREATQEDLFLNIEGITY
jgi:hypothetical protein